MIAAEYLSGVDMMKSHHAMLETGAVERAYEVAASGRCDRVSDIVKILKKEGHTLGSLEMHLGGQAIRKELAAICRKPQSTQAHEGKPA